MKKIIEFTIEKLIFVLGALSIIILVLIFLFLFKNGINVLKFISLKDFLLGTNWYPISEPPKFGIFPLIASSLLVTLCASVMAIPIGVGCAVYIAEVADNRIKELLEPLVEILASIPSVVMGFIGVIAIAPVVKDIFHLNTGLTAFTGSIALVFMSLPTIVSISEDALNTVPREYKEGSLALGATRWQTIYRVTVPAAFSGITAAVMLGIGRAIGETMTVMMICGNAAVIPRSIFEPVRTMTATIASEMGETVFGSSHYYALFAVGLALFGITFIVNFIADYAIHKGQRA